MLGHNGSLTVRYVAHTVQPLDIVKLQALTVVEQTVENRWDVEWTRKAQGREEENKAGKTHEKRRVRSGKEREYNFKR